MSSRQAVASLILLLGAIACMSGPGLPSGRTETPAVGAEAKAKKPKLLVLVVFDQMRGDYLARWEELFGPGGFRRLQHDGAWFTNCHYPFAHTVTAAGHASLLTGCSPQVHGIVGNDWYDRAAGKTVTSVSSDRYERVPRPGGGTVPGKGGGASPDRLLMPTVGDLLKEATGGKARVVSLSFKDRSAILPGGHRADVCLWFDSSAGTFVSSSYYPRGVPGWARDFNGTRPADRWFGKTWERLRPDLDYARYSGPDDVPAEGTGAGQGRTFPHPFGRNLTKAGRAYYSALYNSPFGNDLLLDLAKRAIEGEDLGRHEVPDLLAVSFSSNDAIGHCWGPDSQEVLDVTLRSDQTMHELLDFLDAKVGKGRYLLAVSADHGVCPIPEVARAEGKDAGRVNALALLRGAGEFLSEHFHHKDATHWLEAAVPPWLYFNQAGLREWGLNPAEVEAALAGWLEKQPGVLKAYTRTQLAHDLPSEDAIGMRVRRSFYSERSGDVIIILKPYYLASGPFDGSSTTHGTPFDYDTHVPLLVFGPGIPGGARNELVPPQAIAAIFARALNLRLPAGAETTVPRGLEGPQRAVRN